MPTASERAAAEAERWRGIATRWPPPHVPGLYEDVPPGEHAVVAFFDPNEDLERRAASWGFPLPRPHLDELARFASALADTEREAWDGDVPDLAVKAYESRRLLLADRIAHWAVPWLDAVARSSAGEAEQAMIDRDAVLEIAEEMRISPALSGSEGMVVPGEDAYGPIDVDVPLDHLLHSLWSGMVLLSREQDLSERGPLLRMEYEAAGVRWRSLAEAHPGSARLWLDLADRAERTARTLVVKGDRR